MFPAQCGLETEAHGHNLALGAIFLLPFPREEGVSTWRLPGGSCGAHQSHRTRPMFLTSPLPTIQEGQVLLDLSTLEVGPVTARKGELPPWPGKTSWGRSSKLGLETPKGAFPKRSSLAQSRERPVNQQLFPPCKTEVLNLWVTTFLSSLYLEKYLHYDS